METITKLPDGKHMTIGTREILKSAKAGRIKRIVIASNCPEFLISKLDDVSGVKVEKFFEDESQLGTKLGKPFPIAMVGYEN